LSELLQVAQEANICTLKQLRSNWEITEL
jgi:hypothetical protein